MQALDIGLSALRTQQQRLTTIGNNIANASTPGYSRQRVELVNRPGVLADGWLVGSGVDVGTIRRLRNDATEDALLRNESLLALVESDLSTAEDIERLLTPGSASVHSRLSDFFNRLEELANNPEEPVVRGEFLNAAESLVTEFRQLDTELVRLQDAAKDETKIIEKQVNQLIDDIAGLNERIYHEQAVGRQPNDLLDRRDRLVTELSQLVDVSVETLENGRDVVAIAGGAITITGNSYGKHIEIREDSDGKLFVARESDTTPIPLSSGRLRGLLETANTTIPSVRTTLAEFTGDLIQAADQQYAKGIPSDGPFAVLRGTRSVDSSSAPLAAAGTAFPVTAGELTITVTDPTTGIRSSQRITIDPAVDSLEDVAARLDALNGVTASVEPQTRTLVVAGESGKLIDFTGRPDNTPDLSGVSGTARPEFSGLWTGADNDELTVTVSGAGDIGSTAGLQAVVNNAAGEIVAVLDIGAGYEAGTPLAVTDGISLSFGPGSVTATDTFSTLVTSDSDTTGLLSALGINSLFTGTDPASYALRRDIVDNPELLATSVTGEPGDARNIAALAALRDAARPALQDRTFVERLADLTADAGLDVQSARSQQEQLVAFGERLQQDRDAVSGVDPNEELLRMLEVERAFQAAARFVTVIDETIAELLNIAR